MRPDCQCYHCWERFRAGGVMVRAVGARTTGGPGYALHCPRCTAHGPVHPASQTAALDAYRARYGLSPKP